MTTEQWTSGRVRRERRAQRRAKMREARWLFSENPRVPTTKNDQTPCLVGDKSSRLMKELWEHWRKDRFDKCGDQTRGYISRRTVAHWSALSLGKGLFALRTARARWVRRVLNNEASAFNNDPISDYYGISAPPYLVPGRRALSNALGRVGLHVAEMMDELEKWSGIESAQAHNDDMGVCPRAHNEAMMLSEFFDLHC